MHDLYKSSHLCLYFQPLRITLRHSHMPFWYLPIREKISCICQTLTRQCSAQSSVLSIISLWKIWFNCATMTRILKTSYCLFYSLVAVAVFMSVGAQQSRTSSFTRLDVNFSASNIYSGSRRDNSHQIMEMKNKVQMTMMVSL